MVEVDFQYTVHRLATLPHFSFAVQLAQIDPLMRSLLVLLSSLWLLAIVLPNCWCCFWPSAWYKCVVWVEAIVQLVVDWDVFHSLTMKGLTDQPVGCSKLKSRYLSIVSGIERIGFDSSEYQHLIQWGKKHFTTTYKANKKKRVSRINKTQRKEVVRRSGSGPKNAISKSTARLPIPQMKIALNSIKK